MALATSGLHTLDLPTDACEVSVLADDDDPGEAAARDAALRWKREARPREAMTLRRVSMGRVL